MAQSGSLDSLSLTAISSIALMILSQVADTSYYTYHLPPAIRQVNSSQADDLMGILYVFSNPQGNGNEFSTDFMVLGRFLRN